MSAGAARRLVVCSLVVSLGCSPGAPVNADAGGCPAAQVRCAGRCVDLRLDDAHCGACGAACADGAACAGGTCVAQDCPAGRCEPGFVCERQSCVDRRCVGVSCPTPQRCAAGLCLSPSCGDTRCGPEQLCQDGRCVDARCVGVACPVGARCVAGLCAFEACRDGVRSDSETDVDCGGRCAACGEGKGCLRNADCASASCLAGRCVAGQPVDAGVDAGLDAGFDGGAAVDAGQDAGPMMDAGAPLDAGCPVTQQRCGEQCVDVLRDSRHCGACGAVCPTGRACAGGACYPTACDGLPCSADRVCLTDTCVDVACFGVTCPAQQVCAQGACLPRSCGVQTCGVTEACVGGACVDAACLGVACQGMTVCRGGLCRSESCANQLRDGLESGVDCGGPDCSRCGVDGGCVVGADCQSQVCLAQRCQAPSCADGRKNGAESDTDCGGGCAACPDRAGCADAGDCSSGVCLAQSCAAPSCGDGVRNGAEVGVDCGGGCGGCPVLTPCDAGVDCASFLCAAGRCQLSNCINGRLDVGETDVDCGGAGCPPCAGGGRCDAGVQCQSGVCGVAGRCAAPTCADGRTNGAETDVDCGGTSCAPCVAGRSCLMARDCRSSVCTSGSCSAASCTDAVRNGLETDVDCGGAQGDGGCPRCLSGQACALAADCVGAVCTANQCSAPTLFGLRPPLFVATGATPRDFVLGDLDDDGHLDVAVVSEGAANVTVSWGRGDGTFDAGTTPSMNPALGMVGLALATGDFDGDGDDDLAVARALFRGCCGYDTGALTVYLNLGARTFAAPVDTPLTGSAPSVSAAAGRLDGDARDDLVTGGASFITLDTRTWVAFGAVSGALVGARTFAGGASVALGDVNRDGRVDVVLRNGVAQLSTVLLGTGLGTFQPGSTLTVGVGVGQVRVATLHGDLHPDVVLATSSTGRLSVARGLGDGTFWAPESYAAQGVRGVGVGDLDGDGVVDLVGGGAGLSLLRGLPGAGFQPAEVSFTNLSLSRVELGDVDEDGRLDVVSLSTAGPVVLFRSP